MKTEKRYAEVGERILIVNTTPDESFDDYEEGDILTVTGHRDKQEGKVLVNVPGSASVWPHEYRVIVGEETEV
ncbi:hypothetical protein [Saccharibacillus brassicae]|uniref:Uncharacterized protein n=1 Tax=Saccharibacillus brassicae TaxID=2583377 RepID=A0A4Y6V5A3_SACBS|nr:hypothetical protein [Saccharibacillus brassicae]QDH23475.1 hypothetical protein FFV09_22980 [Saccharibacillus brassicae]